MLALTCTECGKPCRSQTEVDLHKKRTGHENYVDKVCLSCFAVLTSHHQTISQKL